MSPLVSALQRLYEAPDFKAAGSLFTTSQKQALDQFIQQTHSVSCKTSGRGVIYQISQRPVVEQHLRTISPSYFEGATHSELPARATNIASARSSKSGDHRHSAYYLLMRPNGKNVEWCKQEANLDLTNVAQTCGVATLQIESNDAWRSEQPLWLVENQALFDRLDWMPEGTQASVHWYRGQLSNTFLDWLAETERAPEVVLFPDYDGVGLHNFARLHLRLGDRCSFWFMPDWEVKLQKYGSNNIWNDTFSDFKAAGEYFSQHLTTDNPLGKSIHYLLNALKTQGLALEQEAVWL